MNEYRFGYDNGGKNKDLQCVSLYNNETKEINLFFREEDICKQKDQRIAELEKQLAIREIAFLNEIPYWDYYDDWEKFETDEERQLYIKKKLEQAEEALKKADRK